ncbi:F0F1 ATP synthase subunit epsilon [Rhizobium sp. KVB221]|uniref:ATP synthase epsilon chain n=1 Tax=Rhizobium setariae TaxID=2801340 RepID=A0A936YWE3_9HYPH|nr:F0F1 ATP synthase subunit epsilon [Rhizobium setariae]MBL0374982.1 F0F1 ATP synthase subunit epsilon [Rhizobium setariae]
MADSFNFELVSPERLLMSASVTEVVLPATEGEMAVMANHAPFMTTIRPGVITVKEATGETQRFVVFGGFADILPSGCTLLAEAALPVSDFTKDALAKRVNQANTDLGNAANDVARLRISQLIADLNGLSAFAA